MTSKEEKAASVELATPSKVYTAASDGGTDEEEWFSISDIAAERERWLKAVADADKNGYARAKNEFEARGGW